MNFVPKPNAKPHDSEDHPVTTSKINSYLVSIFSTLILAVSGYSLKLQVEMGNKQAEQAAIQAVQSKILDNLSQRTALNESAIARGDTQNQIMNVQIEMVKAQIDQLRREIGSR